MTSALISVIIPAYNIAPYIEGCLDSVLAQTYGNIEVIAVDDGSSDGTGALLDAYAAGHPGVRVIHKENGGVTSARLCGVENARGDWIGFVDGDDRIDPDMYERLLANAEECGADISHCGYSMEFPDGRADLYYGTGKKLVQSNSAGLSDLLTGGFVEPGLWNKLFKRGLFDAGLSGKTDPDIRINEDLLMNFYLFRGSSSSVYEDFCPYHYVLRRGSAATSGLNAHKLWDPVRVAEQMLADAPDGARSAARMRLGRVLISGATRDTSRQPELTAPFQKACRSALRRNTGAMLRDPGVSLGIKAMTLWAAVWPGSYAFVHRTYAKLRGLDKKYDLDR